MSLERDVLALVGNVMGLLELDEFLASLLLALRETMPCDWVSFNEVGPNPQSTAAIADPPVPEHLHEVFARLALENPIAAHYALTGDGRAVRFSDVISVERLHELDIYHALYAHLEVEYQIAFTLPSSPERLLAIALSRNRKDFTDRERDLLNLARPHLIQGYRNAVSHTALLAVTRADVESADESLLRRVGAMGLTRREAQVLSMVCKGRSDRDVAVELKLSHRTVQKHLERSYRKLGVRGRSQAASVVWDSTVVTHSTGAHG